MTHSSPTRLSSELPRYVDTPGGDEPRDGSVPIPIPIPDGDDPRDADDPDDPRDKPEEEQDDPRDVPVVVKATRAAQAGGVQQAVSGQQVKLLDRKSTRLNSSH